jgi:NTE family protein
MVKLLQQPWESPDERLRAICTLARTSDTIAQVERRADIADRVGLPAQGWPETALSITAVDVETLQLSVFNAQSGVSLIDAVAASCAVPGVWPPAEIQGRLYIDGGVWKTPENAHLAVGASRVVILSPFGQVGMGSGGEAGLSADIERLQAAGAEVQVVAADAPSLQAMAPSPLDPATRKPAAEAGRRQAADVASRLRHLF